MRVYPSGHGTPDASLVVCTTRPESYQTLWDSIQRQADWVNYEVITVDEIGPLTRCRNQGLSAVRGPVVSFIDDDTVLPPGWLAGVLNAFRQHPHAVGVSGPALITPYWRQHRQLFRVGWLSALYRHMFLEGNLKPGTICASGAPTTCSADEDCTYEGPVDFLEACNMSWRTEAVREVGGFDEHYTALGEWSEPDLAFRLRAHARMGGHDALCWFTPQASLFHQPARGHATLRRRETRTRMDNLTLFHDRWVTPCPRRALYRTVVRTYFTLLSLGILKP